MHSVLSRPLSTSRFGLSFVAGLLTAGLSACGVLQPDPDVVAAKEMQQLLVLEPFAGASVATSENEILIDLVGESEAGLYLRPSGKEKLPIVVHFSYREDEPLNLRLLKNGEYDYRSASSESYVVLGSGYASEALFYRSGPGSISIEINDIATCDDSSVACLQSGEVAFTPPFEGLEDVLILTPYQNATFIPKNRKEKVLVEPASSGGEYGVFLMTSEKTPNRMLLEYTLKKKSDEDLVTVRSGADDDVVYDRASRGWVVVSDQPEALIYANTPDGFAISQMALTKCGDDDWRCKTHDDLNLLLPARNELDDFQYAVNLLAWSTEHSDYAISSEIEQSLDVGLLRSWQIYFKYYAPNLAGGYCGDTAVFFSRLLRDSGYDSFTWNFGMLQDDLTHVTTILALDGRFYMLDPTFGGYFTKPGSDEPIDVFDLIEGKPFSFKNVMSPNRDFIAAPGDGDRIRRLEELGVIYGCEKASGARRIVCKRRSFGLDEYLRISYDVLAQNQLGNSYEVIVDLMREGLIGVGNMRDTDTMKAFAIGLVDRGIPVVDVDGNLSPRRLLK